MIPKDRSSLPDDVNSVRDLFQDWRRTKKRGAPIPEDLWTAAVGLARECGLTVVSRALSLEHRALRRRMAMEEAARPAHFIELKAVPMPEALVAGGSVVEVVDSDGATMTIRLAAGALFNVAELVGAFRRRSA